MRHELTLGNNSSKMKKSSDLKCKFYSRNKKMWLSDRIKRKLTPTRTNSTRSNANLGGNYCFGGSFRKAICPIIAYAQIFGIMPVTGFSNQSIAHLKFNWKSGRTIYGMTIATLTSIYCSLHLWKTINQKVVFNTIVTILFFCTSTFGFVSFFVIASKWPALMQIWELLEINLTTFHNHKLKRARMITLQVVVFLVILFSIVEHALSVISSISSLEFNEFDPIRILFKGMFPFISDVIDISAWATIPFFFISETATFIWNYLDIFIIYISIGLSTLYELLNYEIEHTKIENLSYDFWLNLRAQYGKLCKLVFMVDRLVSHIIFVSFSNDLLIICKQLFEVLSFKKRSSLFTIYFNCSLIFMMVRTFGVAFFAARIHDESKKPIKLMLGMPSHAWTKESKLFYDEVYCNTVALSGMQFFFLTRNLILSVIGTICTYELVLMQLNRE